MMNKNTLSAGTAFHMTLFTSINSMYINVHVLNWPRNFYFEMRKTYSGNKPPQEAQREAAGAAILPSAKVKCGANKSVELWAKDGSSCTQVCWLTLTDTNIRHH